ncbi:MAG: hypothetical protein LKH76_04940 [Acetobacter fabarum]|uniref:hypothetical protein n=1 Tax=Acetobacter fabarum TaxID=483199 RepID=UPI00242AC588|nr:hypothetical protein [Acetobacter fabarum]MCH4026033.1 hypothetical protein [Acetobacter fabarum]MCH4054781.1 hypothetical protein [Acetobacter fabarum]MCH4086106.1 hypothetical protein [Acetobacter fabarum]MCH4127302.1 hypothetical protein [Acetobacter fabarum]MCH4136650.1 hypothetical protein [Acetobacter fabarum]
MLGHDGRNLKRTAPFAQSIENTTAHVFGASIQPHEHARAIVTNTQITETSRYNDFFTWRWQNFSRHSHAVFFVKLRCAWYLVQTHFPKTGTAQINPHIAVPVCIF